ncbi:MAG: hypothetical protein NXH75_01960 [Halobacteriovoraceae bacterium]|nr:hypothetical protein [Halobacteriovoraceae bacterium]
MNLLNTLILISVTLLIVEFFALDVNALEINTVIVSDSRGSSLGFRDSSFNYRSVDELDTVKFCFVGHINEICPHISIMAGKMNAQYSSGAHDKIDLNSCKVISGDHHHEQEYIKTNYVLSDDYGFSFNVEREIYSCSRN